MLDVQIIEQVWRIGQQLIDHDMLELQICRDSDPDRGDLFLKIWFLKGTKGIDVFMTISRDIGKMLLVGLAYFPTLNSYTWDGILQ